MATKPTKPAGGSAPAAPRRKRGVDAKYSMRLQMPGNDQLLESFVAAQSDYGLNRAVLQLIHMWVARFGPDAGVIETLLALATAQADGTPVSVADELFGTATVPAGSAVPVPAPEAPAAPEATAPVGGQSEPLVEPTVENEESEPVVEAELLPRPAPSERPAAQQAKPEPDLDDMFSGYGDGV